MDWRLEPFSKVKGFIDEPLHFLRRLPERVNAPDPDSPKAFLIWIVGSVHISDLLGIRINLIIGHVGLLEDQILQVALIQRYAPSDFSSVLSSRRGFTRSCVKNTPIFFTAARTEE